MKKQKPPVVNVPAPVVNVEAPKIPDINVPEVKIPEIKIPKIEVPKVEVKIPEIKIPKITVPKPEVTVQAPEVTVNIPDRMKVEGMDELLAKENYSVWNEVSNMKPVPVILTDSDGNAYKAISAAYASSAQSSTSSGSTAQATDGFELSDVDDAGNPSYYGYLKDDGSWYIKRYDAAANQFRYTKGASAYGTAWTNRVSQTYGYFNDIF